jgi:hypothetical protein
MHMDADVRRRAGNALAVSWVIICAIGLLVPILTIMNPAGSSATNNTPPAPAYDRQNNWAALPSTEDGADILPAWCGRDGQREAAVDAFYVTPSSPIGSLDNAPTDDFLSNLLQWASLTQQATPFNGIAAVYAPRYRSASQAVQDLDVSFNWRDSGELPRTSAAMHLAFSDVERAFERIVGSSNRPFILASHSQGTMHLKRLVGRLAGRPDVLNRLVVAYLIGNTVEEHEIHPLPICSTPTMTRCVVSWNTVLDGGDAGRFWRAKATGGNGTVCVNPLTWRTDGARANRSLALGSLPLLGHLFLPRLDDQLIDAQCIDGVLYTSQPPGGIRYPSDIDGGELGCCGRMHTFDIPLFWRNLRENARLRAGAHLNISLGAEPCLACAENAACIAGLAWHGTAALLCLYVLLVVFLFPLIGPCICCTRKGNTGSWPQAFEAVGWSCCCPCLLCVAACSCAGGRRCQWARRGRATASAGRRGLKGDSLNEVARGVALESAAATDDA